VVECVEPFETEAALLIEQAAELVELIGGDCLVHRSSPRLW
jgi:hypothetical protein